MGTKNNPGKFDCHANAEPDEPYFTLLGRDKHAPALVDEWARLREAEGEDPAKVAEARGCAAAMRGFRAFRKSPGSPLVGPHADRSREVTLDPDVAEARMHAQNVAKRPRFESIFIDLAFALAARSTCRRLAVGCVITSTDFRKVLSIGYNGNASGLANDCDGHEPGKCGCLHAEENAVINTDVPRSVEKFVFCTNEPCVLCAKRLINLGGVLAVSFVEPYRAGAGDLLRSVGVVVAQVQRRPGA